MIFTKSPTKGREVRIDTIKYYDEQEERSRIKHIPHTTPSKFSAQIPRCVSKEKMAEVLRDRGHAYSELLTSRGAKAYVYGGIKIHARTEDKARQKATARGILLTN